MSAFSQLVIKPEGRSGWPLAIFGVTSVLLFAALLRVFGVSLVAPASVVGAAALPWLAWRHPLGSLGATLAVMPVFPMAFLLAKFFGPSYIGQLEGFDRVVMLALVFILWWRYGVKFTTPDWFLVACFGLAVVRLAFGGRLLPLLSDFNLLIAYAAGRVAALTIEQQERWAKRAMWVTAALILVGMVEIFIVGDGPRTLLFLAVAPQATMNGRLGLSFSATGYSGMRLASTTLGPLHFAPLCMMALILWWVYFRARLPGLIVAAGLICTVTRSDWLGTAVAIPFLSVVMGQTQRFLRYGALALVMFAVSVPVLGLSDYLFTSKRIEDPSAEDHLRQIQDAVYYVASHPLGVGPGAMGRWALDKFDNANAFFVDDTYLTLAGEYGIPAALCFLGFLGTALWVSCRQRTPLGYAATGVLVGFSVVMVFFIAHDIFHVACWIWFPIGLAVRSSTLTTNGAPRTS